MERTSARPVASGRVAPAAALAFGVVLGGGRHRGCSRSRSTGSRPSGPLAGFVCYVFVYTVWLKRRTPQNIVIGGAAGAVPPLVAWAAVDGLGQRDGGRALRDRLPLDAAPLLGRWRCCSTRTTRAPACRCCRPCAAPRRARRQILVYTLLLTVALARARRARHARLVLRGRRRRARRALHLARRRCCCARPDDRARGAPHVPLLAALPGAAVRRHGRRQRCSRSRRLRRRGARAR